MMWGGPTTDSSGTIHFLLGLQEAEQQAASAAQAQAQAAAAEAHPQQQQQQQPPSSSSLAAAASAVAAATAQVSKVEALMEKLVTWMKGLAVDLNEVSERGRLWGSERGHLCYAGATSSLIRLLAPPPVFCFSTDLSVPHTCPCSTTLGTSSGLRHCG